LRRALCALAAAAWSAAALALDCPKIDFEAQKAKEKECKAIGGLWQRHGIADHLCGIYSCAPPTRDGGKRCVNRADCEYLCLSKRSFPLGTPVVGECAAIFTQYGCFNYVDGGKMVGRICVD